MELKIKVRPNSSKSCIKGKMADGRLKIDIMAAPENGKANAELIRFLSDEYGIDKSKIKIISGHLSPKKLVRIQR